MADINLNSVIATPVADFIGAIARSVADAQVVLDKSSFELFQSIQRDPSFKDFRDIGYNPTWYTIPSVEAEIKLFFHLNSESSTGRARVFMLPFNATTQSKTNITSEGSSQLTLRIVPMPPPAAVAQNRTDDAAK
jgi:hypothetical protein